MTAVEERAVSFACEGAALVGVVHLPAVSARRGLLIVVGGPQYRAGSHRQFLLIARRLAEEGYPVMRFDHRGIGDSDGPFTGFEALDADIAAAMNAFLAQCPQIEEVVLWGLCDAASAILFYAHQDARVSGIVLLNPWVRTPESEAETYLRHYYLRRLTDRGFWQSAVSGEVNPVASARSLCRLLSQRFAGVARLRSTLQQARPLADRMAEGLDRFAGPVLLVICGQDLTAREFDDAAKRSPSWQQLLVATRVTRRDLVSADHTFSRRSWRDSVIDWTLRWLRSW